MTTLHPSQMGAKGKQGARLLLVKRRAALAAQIEKLDVKIAKAGGRSKKPLSLAALDRLLDDVASGPVRKKSLPADFSRADIYHDHD